MEDISLGLGKFIFSRSCDTCRSDAALLFCRADMLFLCLACDARVHASRAHSDHERVWMCEVCEHAPAIVTCKADAAALCAACDRDIHSANPLARRHERVPVVPFFDTAAAAIVKSSAAAEGFLDDVSNRPHTCLPGDETTNVSPSSWLFPNITTKLETHTPEMKSLGFLFSEADQFLEFDGNATDSVVPIQTYEEATTQQVMNQLSNKYMEIDFTGSKFNSPNHKFGAQSISQSISSPSMDFGVVPDGSAVSHPYVQTRGTTADHSDSISAIPSQGADREARVMRYREKRKNRKFEKTIRYASRKAYAETRPRIKGRFAKRSEVDSDDTNNMFVSNPSAFMVEAAGYGIVPSFY